MKTIEEKAKTYDEVREKIALRFGSNVAEEIFSEFEMSEDEKIRKALIKYFSIGANSNATTYNIEDKKILAWLEKQGQKSAEWHREDEQNLNACLGYIPDEFLRRWLTDIIYAKHDKSAWSEEDESMYVRTLGVLGKCYMGKLPTKVEEELKWFKSLKQKIWE
jgi:D-hexose-6-phosphate mutarotase